MNRGKDINKEIDNYVKGNYAKNIAIELLKRDGFSETEINEHIHKLDVAEKAHTMNYIFVPGFLFNVILSLFLLWMSFGNSEVNSLNTISFIGFILSIPLIYFYYKGNKFSIFITGFAVICVMLYLIIGMFTPNASLVNSIFAILFFITILNSVKNYYKSIKL